jgi:hypothetical protein
MGSVCAGRHFQVKVNFLVPELVQKARNFLRVNPLQKRSLPVRVFVSLFTILYLRKRARQAPIGRMGAKEGVFLHCHFLRLYANFPME